MWRVGLEAGSAYEQEVRFIGDGAADAFHRAGGVISGGVANRRWRAELDARGEVVRFAALRDLDRETYDVGSTMSWRMTTRTQAQLGVRALTSTVPSGITQLDPSVLPLLVTRTQAAVFSVASRLGPNSEVVLAVDGARIRFDADGFAGGRTAGALLRLSGRARRTTTIGLQADTRLSDFDSLAVTTALLESDVTQDLGRVRLRVRAGATAAQSAATVGAPAELTVEPTGSVEISRDVRRFSLAGNAGRSMLPAFGFGRVLRTDVAGVSATWTRPRGPSLRLAADASRNTDPVAPGLDLTFLSLSGEWQQPVGDHVRLQLAAFVRRLDVVTPFNNRGVTLSARFDTSR
ncbi:MAG: hypothetical protein MUD17_02495 [Gemmatimonadaceae bacterium]|nr:hypothetical protein [Gemmatimonadaceae bacterium]